MPNNNNLVSKYYKNESLRHTNINNVSKYYKNESLRRRRLRNLTRRLNPKTKPRHRRFSRRKSPLNPNSKNKNNNNITVHNILSRLNSMISTNNPSSTSSQ